MHKRYSLEDLRRLREQHLSDQLERVAVSVQRVATAKHVAEQAARASVSAQQKLTNARSEHAARLDGGQAQVQDLARQAAWESEIGRQLEQAKTRARHAVAQLVSEEQQAARLRTELATKEAELKAVERHKQAWLSAVNRAEELEVEEQALEAWGARASSPNGRGRV